ncbi:HNH endonuclease signature motif containing protein [Humibacillus xanthopallidus]|nr:HNH endonuclease signature motif containing protein [Humibacillus xanthopallidus]
MNNDSAHVPARYAEPAAPELHRRRGARAAAYDAYLASRTWKAKRQQWYAAWLTAAGTPPVCAACGSRWTLKTGHLHHLTYMRLGREEPEDLVPLCARHHRQLHAIFDTSPSWRRLGRAAASAGIIAVLRSRAANQPGNSDSAPVVNVENTATRTSSQESRDIRR